MFMQPQILPNQHPKDFNIFRCHPAFAVSRLFLWQVNIREEKLLLSFESFLTQQ
jgi:hypothetical protein